MPTERVSLYRIDDTLAQLFALREDLTSDGAPPEELAVIDQQLREYQAMVPKKVEGVAAIYRQWGAVRAEIKAERARLAAIDKALEAREERLKSYLAEILEKQPMPAKGCRKLVGAAGSQLLLKRNGGLEPLEIDADADAVPMEYMDVTVRMPLTFWTEICSSDALQSQWSALKPEDINEYSCEPSNKRIREALAAPCEPCMGRGYTITFNVPTMSAAAERISCEACGGSGRQGVPGAHLLPRGSHVEIR